LEIEVITIIAICNERKAEENKNNGEREPNAKVTRVTSPKRRIQ